MSTEIKLVLYVTIVIVVVSCAILSLTNNIKNHKNSSDIHSEVENEIASLSSATGWLNSDPLKTDHLGGKVVLINFCTYTCINWLRTLPYVRSWAVKYKDQGLVVVGVHSPEFPFEKNIVNVSRAIKQLNLNYPIALDNNYNIWRAFKNEYWPAIYLVDVKGYIRHFQFGEGDYEKAELIIQELLAEAGNRRYEKGLFTGGGEGIEVEADWTNLKSNENYLGYERTLNFSSPGMVRQNKGSDYNALTKLALNQWALNGKWNIKGKCIVLNASGGRILYRFHARDLHLVMGPAIRGATIRFRILIDGVPPSNDNGIDTDEQGYGKVTDQRLYQLVRQKQPIVDRQFEIEFLDSGVEAFAFTFG